MMIVVFGSLNVDFVMRVARLPYLGETVIGGAFFTAAGGKGANQACAAAMAGGLVAIVGCVGNDQWADIVLQPLSAAGVDVSYVATSQEAATGCASIWVDQNGENAIAVASGANTLASADQVANGLLGPETLLVAQMETPASENWRLFKRAKKAGSRILLNVAPAFEVPGAVLDLIDFLVVNEIEARSLVGATKVGNIEAAARHLSESHQLACVVTLGADGALCVEDGRVFRVPAVPTTVVDTTGAGDAFIGASAEALARGASLEEAVIRASAAASLACSRAGAMKSFPSGKEIEDSTKSALRVRVGSGVSPR